MRSLKLIILLAWVYGVTALRAETFELNDGKTVTGEIIGKPTDTEIQLKIREGEYRKIPWSDLSQTTLKELAKNPNFQAFAEPFIEIGLEQRVKKTEVTIKKDYPRLDLPKKGSLLGGLFSSSVGIFVLLLAYAANVYAAYEIATVRAYSPPMVCGIAAVAPIIGPVVFLCLPTNMARTEEAEAAAAAHKEAPTPTLPAVPAGDTAAAPAAPAGGLHFADQTGAATAGGALPETQVFQRGQFTFNRRFIETKFAGFFGVIRREADKDMQMIVKSARGEFNVHRINRISASDMHIEIHKGHAASEVAVPFGEIQEIRFRHKDAPA